MKAMECWKPSGNSLGSPSKPEPGPHLQENYYSRVIEQGYMLCSGYSKGSLPSCGTNVPNGPGISKGMPKTSPLPASQLGQSVGFPYPQNTYTQLKVGTQCLQEPIVCSADSPQQPKGYPSNPPQQPKGYPSNPPQQPKGYPSNPPQQPKGYPSNPPQQPKGYPSNPPQQPKGYPSNPPQQPKGYPSNPPQQPKGYPSNPPQQPKGYPSNPPQQPKGYPSNPPQQPKGYPSNPPQQPKGYPSNPPQQPKGYPSNPPQQPKGYPSNPPQQPKGYPSNPPQQPKGYPSNPPQQPKGYPSNPPQQPKGYPSNPPQQPKGYPSNPPQQPKGYPSNPPQQPKGYPSNPPQQPKGYPSNPPQQPKGYPSNPPQQPVGYPTNPPQQPVGYPTNSPQQPVGYPTSPPQQPVGYPTSPPQQPVGYPTSPPQQPVGYPTSPPQQPVGYPTSPPQQPVGYPTSPPQQPVGYPTSPPQQPVGYPTSPPQQPVGYPTSPPQQPVGYPTSPPQQPVGYPTSPPQQPVGYPTSPPQQPVGYPINPPQYHVGYPTNSPQQPMGYPKNPPHQPHLFQQQPLADQGTYQTTSTKKPIHPAHYQYLVKQQISYHQSYHQCPPSSFPTKFQQQPVEGVPCLQNSNQQSIKQSQPMIYRQQYISKCQEKPTKQPPCPSQVQERLVEQSSWLPRFQNRLSQLAVYPQFQNSPSEPCPPQFQQQTLGRQSHHPCTTMVNNLPDKPIQSIINYLKEPISDGMQMTQHPSSKILVPIAEREAICTPKRETQNQGKNMSLEQSSSGEKFENCILYSESQQGVKLSDIKEKNQQTKKQKLDEHQSQSYPRLSKEQNVTGARRSIKDQLLSQDPTSVLDDLQTQNITSDYNQPSQLGNIEKPVPITQLRSSQNVVQERDCIQDNNKKHTQEEDSFQTGRKKKLLKKAGKNHLCNPQKERRGLKHRGKFAKLLLSDFPIKDKETSLASSCMYRSDSSSNSTIPKHMDLTGFSVSSLNDCVIDATFPSNPRHNLNTGQHTETHTTTSYSGIDLYSNTKIINSSTAAIHSVDQRPSSVDCPLVNSPTVVQSASSDVNLPCPVDSAREKNIPTPYSLTPPLTPPTYNLFKDWNLGKKQVSNLRYAACGKALSWNIDDMRPLTMTNSFTEPITPHTEHTSLLVEHLPAIIDHASFIEERISAIQELPSIEKYTSSIIEHKTAIVDYKSFVIEHKPTIMQDGLIVVEPTTTLTERSTTQSQLSPGIPQVSDNILLQGIKPPFLQVSPGLLQAEKIIQAKHDGIQPPSMQAKDDSIQPPSMQAKEDSIQPPSMQAKDNSIQPPSMQAKDDSIQPSSIQTNSRSIESTCALTRVSQSQLMSLNSSQSNPEFLANRGKGKECVKLKNKLKRHFRKSLCIQARFSLCVPPELELPCLLCGIMVQGEAALYHLFFGLIKCAECNCSLKTCADFKSMEVFYTPCKNKTAEHETLVWSSDPIDFLSYHTRKYLMTKDIYAANDRAPSTTDIVEAMVGFLTQFSALENHSPWAQALYKCWNYVRNMQASSDLTSRVRLKTLQPFNSNLKNTEDSSSLEMSNDDSEDCAIEKSKSPVMLTVTEIQSFSGSERVPQEDSQTLNTQKLDSSTASIVNEELLSDKNARNKTFSVEGKKVINLAADTLKHAEHNMSSNGIPDTNIQKSRDVEQTPSNCKVEDVNLLTSDPTVASTFIPESCSEELVESHHLDSDCGDFLLSQPYNQEMLEQVVQYVSVGDNAKEIVNHINLISDSLSQSVVSLAPPASPTTLRGNNIGTLSSAEQRSSNTGETNLNLMETNRESQSNAHQKTFEDVPKRHSASLRANYIPRPMSKKRLTSAINSESVPEENASVPVHSEPVDRNNFVLYSYPSEECPNDCPMCYTSLFASRFVVNLKTYMLSGDCLYCGLLIFVDLDPADVPSSSYRFKGINRPCPKSKRRRKLDAI